MNTLKKSFILFCLILIVRDAIGEYDPDLAIRARNKASVDQILKENTEKYKNNPDMLVLPGLIADRKAQKVTLLAEATGLTKGSPVEFFLVSETSGHGYESLAVSFAMPGNLQKSLEFIGMKPGRTADAGKCAFWPKGERVIVTFKSKDPEQKDGSTRIETLVLDSRSQKPLPECGLVFTGSPLIQSPEKPGTNVFASDAREPGSLASTYNALETVLDVPFSWAQKTVYGNILANHSNTLKTGSLLEITFEPEYKDGKKRVTDLSLWASVKTGTEGKAIGDLVLQIKDASGTVLNSDASLNSALKIFDSMNEKGLDPFVSVRLADDIPVKAIAELSAVLLKIDSENGIRIEPPREGRLYYRAFVPNEQNRDRTQRIGQPWELALSLTNSQSTGVLTRIDQVWKDDKLEPDLKAVDFAINTPQDLQKLLKEKGPGIPVIFVFTDPLITHGQLMSFIGPVLESYPMIHVYIKR